MRVSAFCLWVKFIFGHYVVISFDPSGLSRPAMAVRRDAKSLPGVLVDPFLVKPLPRVGVVWRYEMKFLWVNTVRVPKWDYVSSQQKIEWLNLVGIGLTCVQRVEAFHQEWAANSSSSDGRKMCKLEFSCPQAAGLADNHLPDCRSPVAIGRFRVSRI